MRLGVAVGILWALSIIGLVWYASHRQSVSADDGLPGCMAGENEICPSEKWVKNYEKWVKLGPALKAGIPGGYDYSADKGKFVKNVVVVQPATPKAAPPKK